MHCSEQPVRVLPSLSVNTCMSRVLPHPAAICSTFSPLNTDLDGQGSVNKRSCRSDLDIYHLITLIHSRASDRKGRDDWEARGTSLENGGGAESSMH